MPTISSNIWSAVIIDTAYAGGGVTGGAPAALDEHSLVQGTDTLVGIDAPITAKYPTAIPEREVQKDLTGSLVPTSMGTLQIPPGEGNVNGWLQTDDWYDYAISGTFGGLMSTFTWHTDNGAEELDHFGCWVSKLVITAEKGKPTLQDVSIKSRSWKAGNAMTKVVYQAGAKSYMDNVSATIDSLTSANLVINKLVLTIENTVEEDKSYGLGDNKIQYPALLDRKVTLEIWHLKTAANTWAADARNTTAQNVGATIVLHTTLTSTITNLYVLASNTDDNSMGIKQNYHSFAAGVGFTIA